MRALKKILLLALVLPHAVLAQQPGVEVNKPIALVAAAPSAETADVIALATRFAQAIAASDWEQVAGLYMADDVCAFRQQMQSRFVPPAGLESGMERFMRDLFQVDTYEALSQLDDVQFLARYLHTMMQDAQAVESMQIVGTVVEGRQHHVLVRVTARLRGMGRSPEGTYQSFDVLTVQPSAASWRVRMKDEAQFSVVLPHSAEETKVNCIQPATGQ